MKQLTEGGAKTMAKITGNQIHAVLNKGITIPPIELLGAKLSNIIAIASGYDATTLELTLRWKTHTNIIHSYKMPERELTDDEIITILAVIRMS